MGLATLGGVDIAAETTSRIVRDGVCDGGGGIWIRRSEVANTRITLAHALRCERRMWGYVIFEIQADIQEGEKG